MLPPGRLRVNLSYKLVTEILNQISLTHKQIVQSDFLPESIG